ncbi:NAD-dependent epimerase/dehydratase family protein [Blastopirellula sp. JC732]|uniref:NAD-dependent epimerase/dehydratase family protein n=1 Tax=Blastopirellula sediminis TaxID=2894196 RepID=A0A9X1MMW3_9BACT|nr:NAD-dependent epimerase/dehydratase family protein [Blastopirellula sediminis]MCC9608809.1 NAD-dependent epimerase/dehydratase family protein [Blastopirellula sediminis]MCC9628414.1 NAD-dependent epimerase/dehydratase family protein [Blastopirellula sediminis]
MRALVTGGGGFLGRYVVEQLLARGDQVRVLGRRDYPDLTALGVECVRGDVADANIVSQACAGMDVVFHTAAIAGIWGRWEDFYQANVVGTENVVAGCHEHGVSRLVYTSSPSVTFDGTDQNGVGESVPYPTRWLAHYPRSKAIAEQYVLKANQPGKLLTCALRPHLIWGPRDQHLIPRLIERAKSGKLRIVGHGRNMVDMIYVENAAFAHLQAADALREGGKVCGKAYFLSQGEPVMCWVWINELLKLAKIPPLTRKISYRAAYAIGWLMEWGYRILGKYNSEPRMTRFLAAQLATNHYFNIAAARHDFGYAPKINTQEGMRRLAETL